MTNEKMSEALEVTEQISRVKGRLSIISGMKAQRATGRTISIGVSGAAGKLDLPDDIADSYLDFLQGYYEEQVKDYEQQFAAL